MRSKSGMGTALRRDLHFKQANIRNINSPLNVDVLLF